MRRCAAHVTKEERINISGYDAVTAKFDPSRTNVYQNQRCSKLFVSTRLYSYTHTVDLRFCAKWHKCWVSRERIITHPHVLFLRCYFHLCYSWTVDDPVCSFWTPNVRCFKQSTTHGNTNIWVVVTRNPNVLFEVTLGRNYICRKCFMCVRARAMINKESVIGRKMASQWSLKLKHGRFNNFVWFF